MFFYLRLYVISVLYCIRRSTFYDISKVTLNLISHILVNGVSTASHWSCLPVSHKILGLFYFAVEEEIKVFTHLEPETRRMPDVSECSCDLNAGHSFNFFPPLQVHFAHSRCRLKDLRYDIPICYAQQKFKSKIFSQEGWLF
jgi:hypothetical protein